MNTDKNSIKNVNQPSCLDAIVNRFLYVIYFIIVSIIIGTLLPITPIYFIATGKDWIQLLIKKANDYSDVLFKDAI